MEEDNLLDDLHPLLTPLFIVLWLVGLTMTTAFGVFLINIINGYPL